MMGEPHPPYLTVEEYLAGEEFAEERHEYFDGTVWAMAGATRDHEIVTLNFATALHAHLRGSGCMVFKGDLKVRLKVRESTAFYYPDVGVACDPTDNHQLYVERPKLLIEVASRDTRKDFVEKLFAYQHIAALEEYVVASRNPADPWVHIFRRAEGWEPGDSHREGKFTLRSVDLTLNVADLYV
ncbi:MAG TPA: Uma2 family endonuclease [Chthoniobacteraceae bacterium]|jgi:Uma2 family endonuclease|nr:Uma2 family endonuclease [Chthoniobacteraceae bacterium]